MTTKKYSVSGMSCAACQAAVDKAVCSLNGVESVSVSLMTNSMTVSYNEDLTSEEEIFTSVKNAGYSPSEWVKREVTEENERLEYRAMVKRLVISAIFAILMMYVTMGHMIGLPIPEIISPHGAYPLNYALIQVILTVPVLFVNRGYLIDGAKALIHKSPNMNTLVMAGVTASFLYGLYILSLMLIGLSRGEEIHHYTSDLYFESATMILTLITLGRTLEHRARRHTSDAVRKLLALAPKTAEVIRDGETVTVNSDELRVGDRVIIRSGASSPCDGIVVSGEGAADESVITGESVTIPKSDGDTVIAGTILTVGYVEISATHVGEDTTVAKITKLVEDAASSKAPAQKLADKISGIFVPIVFAIAAVTFTVWLVVSGSLHTAVGYGISVVVISCPCALGLATPTAIMSGVGRGAMSGILIKSADVIDVLYRSSVVALDKTGTVTEGKMSVSDVVVIKGDESELLGVAYSLEEKSEHPVGIAIVEYASDKVTVSPLLTDFTQTFGGGVSAFLASALVAAGNREFLASLGITVDSESARKADELASVGKTPIIISKGREVIGIIAIADTIKKTSKKAVEELSSLGFSVVMLTGDNERTARAIASEAGIDNVISGVKPDEKAGYIEKLMTGEYFGEDKRHYTVMIGDGVNDAPALAMADCGIAVAHGTDIAIESAGVVLVHNDLTDAARAVRLSRAVMRNIKQNLTWAFLYNILCIPIAAGVLSGIEITLTPMIASAAMSFSSICVVSNALRLRGAKLD